MCLSCQTPLRLVTKSAESSHSGSEWPGGPGEGLRVQNPLINPGLSKPVLLALYGQTPSRATRSPTRKTQVSDRDVSELCSRPFWRPWVAGQGTWRSGGP